MSKNKTNAGQQNQLPNQSNTVANDVIKSLRDLFASSPLYGITNDGETTINQKVVISHAKELRKEIVELVLSSPLASSLFVKNIGEIQVLDQIGLLETLFSMQEHLKGSFTAFPNKIGMFVDKFDTVELSFPYKDCVLVGGMTKEDAKSSTEVFFSERLSRDKIDKLFEPKILCNAVRHALSPTSNGDLEDKNNILEEPASEIRFVRTKEESGAEIERLADNILVKGNNLLALHTLAERLQGSVDVIYIDPPYYFKEQKDQDTFSYNSNFKLSTWLAFMKNRLEIAKRLLAPNGFICISISEDGHAHLKLLCDDIFGVDRFVGDITWESKTKSQNTKTSKTKLQTKTEFILVYKHFDAKPSFLLTEKGKKEYPLKDKNGAYRLQPIEEMSLDGMRGRETMVYPILDITPRQGKQWKIGSDTVNSYKEHGGLLLENGKPYFKTRPEDEDENTYNPFWSHFFDKDVNGTAESGKAELTDLFGSSENHGFETVKPVALIKNILSHIKTGEHAVILDFFGGSGTTGHAVMQLNKEKPSVSRKFILVEQLEYAERLTAERVRRAMIKNQYQDSFVFVEMLKDDNKLKIQACSSIKELTATIKSLFGLGVFQYTNSLEELVEQTKTVFEKAGDDIQAAIKYLLEEHYDHNTEYKSIRDFIEHEADLSPEDVAVNKSFHRMGV